MQCYCQQLVFRQFKSIFSPNFFKIRIEFSHIRLTMSDAKGKISKSIYFICLQCFNEHLFVFAFLEGSSQQYRDKKDKENEDKESSSSESDNDDGAAEYGGGAQSASEKSRMAYVQKYLKQLGLTVDGHNQVLKTVDFEGIINHWNEHGFKKIITMVGAGISTCKFSRKKI